MKAKLLVTSADARGEEFEIGREATLGRSRSSEIRLEEKGVSSRHARIYFDADRQRYFLEDLDSLNGTTLDGLEVTRPEPLDPLHVIGIAGVREFIFQELSREPDEDGAGLVAEQTNVGEAEAREELTAPTVKAKTSVDEEMPPLPANLVSEGEEAEPPTAPTLRSSKTAVDEKMPPVPANLATDEEPTAPVPKTAVDEEMPSLPANLADEVAESEADDSEARAAEAAAPEAEMATEPAAVEQAGAAVGIAFSLRFEGDGESEAVPLPEGERVVGRSRSADITVESRSVSRRHALLTVAAGRVVLRDLESRNHTYLEDEQVTEEVELAVGAKLRFGDLEAVLVGEEAEA